MESQKIPIIVITGFLGSGKTTLLNQLISSQPKSAVIINEFGSTPIDQDLLQQNSIPLTVLAGGCLCCQIKGTLTPTLKNLWMRWNSCHEKPFDRIIIETSGVASPEPILDTLLRERWLAKHYQLQQVITTVAIPSVLEQLKRFGEVNAQIAWADLLLLTHVDTASPQQIKAVEQQLAKLAPAIEKIKVTTTQFTCHSLLDRKTSHLKASSKPTSLPITQFHSASVYIDQPPTWPQLQAILQTLLDCYQDKILRIKGVIYPADQSPAFAIHATNKTLYMPSTLITNPSDQRHSKLVFIGTSELDNLQAELMAQLALVKPS